MNAIEEHARSVFLGAFDRAPEQWPAFVSESCGDNAELKARVDQLLRAHQAMGSIRTVAASDVCERVGAVIGPYKLLEQIGEGGMGLVFVAEQKQPVRRKVALKLIKPGMDSKQVLARFEAEQQALALMDHPNIAKVLEAGTTDAGRPYFVMELVHGIAITDYCDQARFTIRERLALFVLVCRAVQHAHTKGIIHRDLKPGNVLVTSNDGVPVPKVIDFGVSKALDQSLTERTLHTGFAQMIGTPLYMSPEQAEFNQIGVDTRSDIYSLGVLLYELLTGTTPLDKERLRQSAFDEILRLIREEEPPRPSTCVSTLGANLETVSERRGADPRKLIETLHGELDWIILKALEKDRDRRYETASAFAADVQRYLKDEPVLACPPSAVYRLKKFGRRNRTALTMTATVVAFLLILGGGLGWVAQDQVARRSLANKNAHEALDVADARLADGNPYEPELVTAVRKAEVQLDDELISAELRERLVRVRSDLSMLATLERTRMEKTAVVDNHFDHARTAVGYARAFREYGIDVASLATHEAAAQVRERTIARHLVAALDDWAGLLLSERRTKEAEHLLAVGREADGNPWRNRVRDALATKDGKLLEELAAAAPVDDLPATSLILLARSLTSAGRRPSAIALLQQSQRRFPADFWINHDLAESYTFARPPRLAEAVEFFRAAVALRPDSPGAHLNLGFVLRDLGRLDDALASVLEALRLQPGYADAHNNRGVTLDDQGKLDEALTCFKEAIRLNPTSHSAHHNLGTVLKKLGKFDEAIVSLREAIRLKPDNPLSHNNLGNALRGSGKLDEAIASFNEAIRLDPKSWMVANDLGIALFNHNKLEEAIVRFEEALRLDPNHAEAHYNLGNARLKQNKLEEAIAHYKQARGLKPDFALAHMNLGIALAKQRKFDEAVVSLQEAVRLAPNHAISQHNLGCALSDQGKLDEAITKFNEAIRLDPNYAEAHNDLGDVYLAKKQPSRAIAAYEQAIAVKKDYAEAYVSLGIALTQQRMFDEAIISLRKGIRLSPGVAQGHYNLGRALSGQGKLDDAIESYKHAIRFNPNFAEAHCNLGDTLRQKGMFSEALDSLRRGHDLGSKDPHWPYPSGQWIVELERRLKTDIQLKKLVKLGQRHEFKGQLTKNSPLLDGKHSKTYTLQLKAGQHYLIDLMSSEFDTYLIVKNAAGQGIAEDDDGGQGTDSRLLFVPEADGEYKIVVLACEAAALGSYTLRVQEYQPVDRKGQAKDQGSTKK